MKLTPVIGVRTTWRKLAEWFNRRIMGLTHRHKYHLVATNWVIIENSQHAYVYRKRFDLYECELCGVTKTKETVEYSE